MNPQRLYDRSPAFVGQGFGPAAGLPPGAAYTETPFGTGSHHVQFGEDGSSSTLWGSQFWLQPPFRRLLLTALLTLSIATAASLVPVSNFKEVETETNARFASEPWDLLGEARGSYLPGYGAIFTFELSLVNVPPLYPFKMTVTPQEVRGFHDRKIKQLAVLKTEMQDLVVKAASSLATMPPAEQIVFEARLLNRSFEDGRGLPNRLIMTANRQKVLDAVAHHATPADLAKLIEEREE